MSLNLLKTEVFSLAYLLVYYLNLVGIRILSLLGILAHQDRSHFPICKERRLRGEYNPSVDGPSSQGVRGRRGRSTSRPPSFDQWLQSHWAFKTPARCQHASKWTLFPIQVNKRNNSRDSILYNRESIETQFSVLLHGPAKTENHRRNSTQPRPKLKHPYH